MQRKCIGFYNYTVYLTYIGMLCGFACILLSICQRFTAAAGALGLSGLCDLFDGGIASTKKDRTDAEKRFGIQIDSLSDVICFGAAPGVFVFSLCGNDLIVGAVCGLFTLAGLIRLAYFNVIAEGLLPELQTDKKSFLGLPITVSAFLVPTLYIFYLRGILPYPILFPILLALTGIGYVTPIRCPKAGKLGKLIFILYGVLVAIGLLWK